MEWSVLLIILMKISCMDLYTMVILESQQMVVIVFLLLLQPIMGHG